MPAFQGSDSRRALYRVVYPSAERPTIDIDRRIHEVVDVSERGLRYEVADLHVPEVGTLVYGMLHFKSDDEIGVTGEVIRTRAGLVVLSLEPPGIPFSIILHEQRYLRGKGFRLVD